MAKKTGKKTAEVLLQANCISRNTMIQVAKVQPSPLLQQRQDLGDLEGLASSIKASGQINPVIVREGKKAGTYELVDGLRRRAAVIIAGVGEIKADVYKLEDDDVILLSSSANLHKPLTLAEQVIEVSQLYMASARGKESVSFHEMAKLVGRSPRWLAARWAISHTLSAKHRKIFLEMSNVNITGVVERLMRFSKANLEREIDRLSQYTSEHHRELKINEVNAIDALELLDELEREAKRLSLLHAPFNPAEEFEGLPMCAGCQYRTGNTLNLFVSENNRFNKSDNCANGSCYSAKTFQRFVSLQKLNPDLVALRGLGSGDTLVLPPTVKVMESYLVKTYTRPTAGAKPALVLSGENAGSMVYALAASMGTSARETKKELQGAELLAEKELQLQNRRSKIFVAEVHGYIEKILESEKAIASLVDSRHNGLNGWRTAILLIATLGTSENACRMGSNSYSDTIADLIKGTDKLGAEELLSFLGPKFWKEALMVMRSQLVPPQNPKNWTVVDANANSYAALLGMPTTTMRDRAMLEAPEPKSLGKLRVEVEAAAQLQATKKAGRESKKAAKAAKE